MSRRLPLLLALSAFLLPALPAADDSDAVAADKAELKAAGVASDGPGLLAFVKKRTLSEKDRAKIKGLIEKLGDDDFDERQKATQELVDMGPVARPQLKAALALRDAEVRKRAAMCLAKIGRTSTPGVLSAAVRLLAHHGPAGATEALLDYLPNIEEPEVVDEAITALAAVGVPKGKADPALVKALADKLPLKRAAAGEALAKAGGKAHRADARKLLKDADARVRRRVALALLEAKDKEAVPVLIALLTAAENEDWWRVDEALQPLGGDKGPATPAETTAVEKKKYQAAWQKWWKDNEATVDLAKLDLSRRLLNYLLVVQTDLKGAARTAGVVYELDAAGKERWKIGGLRNPIMAQVVGRDRVVIAESTLGNLSLRKTDGTEVWSKRMAGGQLSGVQVLPGGNVFVTCRNMLLELDKDGKELWSIKRPSYDVIAAAKDRDGSIGMVLSSGRFVRTDTAGKELSSFALGATLSSIGTQIQLLPGKRVLIPNYIANKVVEYDATGKEVWSAAATRPAAVRRLPNGNTLVTSRSTARGGKAIVELDKAGREVWSKSVDGRLYYADKR